MTKHEVREYLTKIYNIDVQNVNTAIHLGQYIFLYFLLFINGFLIVVKVDGSDYMENAK